MGCRSSKIVRKPGSRGDTTAAGGKQQEVAEPHKEEEKGRNFCRGSKRTSQRVSQRKELVRYTQVLELGD